jgi:hypothetical protein
LFVIGLVVGAATIGLLGGGPVDRLSLTNEQAELAAEIPQKLRSGLLFESRIDVSARQPVTDVTIGLSPEMWERITINTVIPEPESEDFRDGRFRMHFGPLKPGETLKVRLESQVNAARWGAVRGNISLYDGNRPTLTLPTSMTVFP